MMRGTAAWAFVLVLSGCGGAAPEPKTEDVAPPASEPAASPESAPSTEPAPEKAEPAAKSSEASESAAPATLSPEDLNAVMQAVLDDPELDGYLQKKAGRKPVKLSGSDLPKDLKAVKAGYPVTVIDAPKSEKDPVIVVTRIGLEGNIATVVYRYDVEGIRGTTRVKKNGSTWELMSSRIVEK